MQQTELIHRIADTVHAIEPQAEVILYGSQARNDAREDSDVDLLILLDKDRITNHDIERITYPLYDLEQMYDYRICISPQVYTREQWYNPPFKTPFYVNVMNEGVRL